MVDYNKVNRRERKQAEVVDVETGEVVERPKMKKVVSKTPKKVKKSLMERLVLGILGPDGLPSIGRYVRDEIVKPTLKDLANESMHSAIDMISYGRDGGGGRRGRRGRGKTYYDEDYKPKSNYTSMYRGSGNVRDRDVQPSRSYSSGKFVEEYVIDSRNEAKDILSELQGHIHKYNAVSVLDYYDLLGITDAPYTMNNFGWHDLDECRVLAARGGGYLIDLPKMEVI